MPYVLVRCKSADLVHGIPGIYFHTSKYFPLDGHAKVDAGVVDASVPLVLVRVAGLVERALFLLLFPSWLVSGHPSCLGRTRPFESLIGSFFPVLSSPSSSSPSFFCRPLCVFKQAMRRRRHQPVLTVLEQTCAVQVQQEGEKVCRARCSRPRYPVHPKRCEQSAAFNMLLILYHPFLRLDRARIDGRQN